MSVKHYSAEYVERESKTNQSTKAILIIGGFAAICGIICYIASVGGFGF